MKTIKNLLIGALKEFINLFRALYQAFERMNPTSDEFVSILHAMTIPLQLVAKILGIFGEGALEAVIMFKMLNSLIPMNTIYTIMQAQAQMTALGVEEARVANMMAMAGAMVLVNGLMFGGLLLLNKESEAYQTLGKVMVMVAGAMMGYSIAAALAKDPAKINVPYAVAAAAAGAVAMLAFSSVMRETMQPPELDYKPIDLSGLGGEVAVMDSGGVFLPKYDSGGITQDHGLAMLQKGETVIPKGQNMLGGGGVTINVHGDVYDGDMFAQKMAVEMANALRITNDTGGI